MLYSSLEVPFSLRLSLCVVRSTPGQKTTADFKWGFIFRIKTLALFFFFLQSAVYRPLCVKSYVFYNISFLWIWPVYFVYVELVVFCLHWIDHFIMDLSSTPKDHFKCHLRDYIIFKTLLQSTDFIFFNIIWEIISRWHWIFQKNRSKKDVMI